MNNKFINVNSLNNSFVSFKGATPFDHCVVDNFLEPNFASLVENEFINFDSDSWFTYSNALEDKKTLNDWNIFPYNNYLLFSYLTSEKFVTYLSKLYGKKLYPDPGLHGGGWHIHDSSGNLNPHLDYSIHPKLKLQRVINLIIFISKELKPEHGGYLGLWSHDQCSNQPLDLITEVEPRFNRAIFFDTTQNSWHGMSKKLLLPQGIYRKSLAVYYLCDTTDDTNKRGKALYAPRVDQRNDPGIRELINMRAGIDTSKLVYRKKS